MVSASAGRQRPPRGGSRALRHGARAPLRRRPRNGTPAAASGQGRALQASRLRANAPTSQGPAGPKRGAPSPAIGAGKWGGRWLCLEIRPLSPRSAAETSRQFRPHLTARAAPGPPRPPLAPQLLPAAPVAECGGKRQSGRPGHPGARRTLSTTSRGQEKKDTDFTASDARVAGPQRLGLLDCSSAHTRGKGAGALLGRGGRVTPPTPGGRDGRGGAGEESGPGRGRGDRGTHRPPRGVRWSPRGRWEGAWGEDLDSALLGGGSSASATAGAKTGLRPFVASRCGCGDLSARGPSDHPRGRPRPLEGLLPEPLPRARLLEQLFVDQKSLRVFPEGADSGLCWGKENEGESY